MTWTREETEKLIEIYEGFPHLYDTENGNYYNRVMREQTLRDIVEKLKNYKSNINMEKLKKKIKGLQTQYHRDKKRIMSNKNGEAVEIDFPRLWCYDRLRFLDSYSTARRTKLNNLRKATNNSTILDENNLSKLSLRSENRVDNKTKKVSKEESAVVGLALKIMTENMHKGEDQFANYISKELAGIKDEEIVTEAKLQIHQVLSEFKMKYLRKCKNVCNNNISVEDCEYSPNAPPTQFISVPEIHIKTEEMEETEETSSEDILDKSLRGVFE